MGRMVGKCENASSVKGALKETLTKGVAFRIAEMACLS